ncbi:MAG: hypothetical protein JW776_11045 [Candidatus Lokiarchaeota archaeon]|nr:hypothetical protein [Candidatus Lokiarchaeota archaeon]
MKKTTKLLFTLVLTCLSLLTVEIGTFVLAIPPTDTHFQSYTGHSLSEDSWNLIYDVIGDQVVTDYSPGPFAENITYGLTDDRLITDANFYVAYTNFGQIQSMYIANQNITLSTLNATKYGCSPYQLMINHFHTAGDLEVFTINTFMGLLAYRENATVRNGIPNMNEEMYLGWTAYSELFKHLFNEGLERSGVPEPHRFNPLQRTSGTPIQMTEETVDNEITYRYGMTYEDIFVVWQEIEVNTISLNDTDRLNYVNVVERVSAFGVLDSLNYTYEVKGINSESGEANVSTTTSYEIGEFSQLWIMDDTPTVAVHFGGYNYTYITGRPMAYYNETSSITDRLDGDATIPGFSLAVANYANLFVLGVRPPERVLRDDENIEFNPDSDRNITRSEIMLRARRKLVKAFEISFKGKETYILDGDIGNPKQAINVIVANTKMRNPMATHLYSIASSFIERVFRTIYRDFGTDEQNLIIYNSESLFYLTCFPEWGGKSIINDPTFTVFGNLGAFLGIPGMQIGLIIILSLVAVTAVYFVLRRKRKI